MPILKATVLLIATICATASATTLPGIPDVIVDAKLTIPMFTGIGQKVARADVGFDKTVVVTVNSLTVPNGTPDVLNVRFTVFGQPDFFVDRFGYISEEGSGNVSLFVNGFGNNATGGPYSTNFTIPFIYGQPFPIHIQATAHVDYEYTTLLFKPASQTLAGTALSYHNGRFGSYVVLTDAYAGKDQEATVQ